MAILINQLTSKDESAEIVSPIMQQDIDCFKSEWKPRLDEKIELLKQQGLYTRQGIADHNVEDAHWEWPEKLNARIGMLEWNSYAVRCAGMTQGLMFVNMLHKCRHPSQLNSHMVYVDLVSTAPWNRPGMIASPHYRGVGLILLTEAILLSMDEDFHGRIGLHALPRAAEFYRTKMGMEPLGCDAQYSNLEYFEMTEQGAARFLGL